MTKFQKLRKGLVFVVSWRYHLMLTKFYLLISELPFANEDSLVVKSAYHLVRVGQSVYGVALLLGDDKFIKTSKEFLDQSMSNWFSMV